MDLLKELWERKQRLLKLLHQAKEYGWIDEATLKAEIKRAEEQKLTIGVIGQMKAGGIAVANGRIDARSYYSVVGGANPLWSEYIYDATNVRLQEAHVSYLIPKKLLGDKVRLSLGLTARNLLMIYNKAPFDPELTASTGTYYQGFDYFMQPSLRNLGFTVKLQF